MGIEGALQAGFVTTTVDKVVNWTRTGSLIRHQCRRSSRSVWASTLSFSKSVSQIGSVMHSPMRQSSLLRTLWPMPHVALPSESG